MIVVRLNLTFIVVLLASIFAGSLVPESTDTAIHHEAHSFSFDLQENNEGNDDPVVDIFSYTQKEIPSFCYVASFVASHHAQIPERRLVSYPALPQAPPAHV